MSLRCLIKNISATVTVAVIYLSNFALIPGRALAAQSLNQEMSALAVKLSKSLESRSYTNIAAVDFTDLQGQSTELGRFLSEQLTVEMVLADSVTMVDRSNIKSILAEHKLTEEGLVNPANAKKLGEFAGVDAILLGNVTMADDGVVLMVKAISTASAKIVAAGRITFEKGSEIQQLLNRSVTDGGKVTASTASGGAVPSYSSANAIATKDVGSIRVMLKTVLPLKLERGGSGIRCSFELANLETQRPILVALNAVKLDRGEMGPFLRSSIIDNRGGMWGVANKSVVGVGIVGVGLKDWNGLEYDPSEIVKVLLKRDELKSDVADEKTNFSYRFVYGTLTEVPPGKSASVLMTFIPYDGNPTVDGQREGSLPSVFQISSEIVVAVPAPDGKQKYSLNNITFDKVALPPAQ